MTWTDDAIRGSDADPYTMGDDDATALDPLTDPGYVRSEDVE